MNDDANDITGRAVSEIETNGFDAGPSPSLRRDLDEFVASHTVATNIALAHEVAARLDADGYTTEASAWRAQANSLEVLNAFAGSDTPEPLTVDIGAGLDPEF